MKGLNLISSSEQLDRLLVVFIFLLKRGQIAKHESMIGVYLQGLFPVSLCLCIVFEIVISYADVVAKISIVGVQLHTFLIAPDSCLDVVLSLIYFREQSENLAVVRPKHLGLLELIFGGIIVLVVDFHFGKRQISSTTLGVDIQGYFCKILGLFLIFLGKGICNTGSNVGRVFMLECLLVVANNLANVGYIVTELDVDLVVVGILFCQTLQLPNHYLLILNA